MAGKWPEMAENGQKWPKWGEHNQKWPQMAEKWVKMVNGGQMAIFLVILGHY